jgi:4-hydroxy-tetrahydrodipicolinate synthase
MKGEIDMLQPEGMNPGSYTPFTADNKLDEKVLAEQLQHVVEGSGGLHGPAGHSEFASLTFDEWKGWTNVLVDVAKRAKIPSWSFLGAESFEKTVPYVEYALKAGASGIFMIAPYFNLYGQDAAYLYYRDMAKEFSDTPIVFYPSHQTGNHFTPATIGKIAELPNIVGMKLNGDASFDEIGKTILLTKDIKPFRWVAGGLNVLYPLMCSLDFKATCSPMSNFAHHWSLNFWRAYQAHDWPAVEKWQKKLNRVASVMNVSGDRHIGARAGHKAALALLGRPVGLPRRPGVPASDEHVAKIRKVFEEEGLL